MLAHELSHVAHRDVVVMTVASFLGVLAGIITRFAFYSEMFGGGRRNDRDNSAGLVAIVMLVSAAVYAVSFVLIRTLSRYRELAADRSGALLTGRPSSLASALVKVTGDMGRIPTNDLRRVEPINAFFFTPALAPGASLSSLFSTHPSLERRLENLGVHRPRARPAGLMGFLDSLLGRSKPVKSNLDDLFALPTAALTLQAAMGLVGTGQGAVCFKAAEGSAFSTMQSEVEALLAADGGTGAAGARRVRLHLAGLQARRRRHLRPGDRAARGQLLP